MKKLSFRFKQIVMLIMLLMITMVSCFALSGCGKTDKGTDDSAAVIQVEEEEVIEEEAEPED